MWKITRDHLWESDPDDVPLTPSRVDTTGETVNIGLGPIWAEIVDLPADGPLIKFKLYDDDGELYYEGELNDDDECLNQQAVLSWARNDSGCTMIKVLRDDEWVQEID